MVVGNSPDFDARLTIGRQLDKSIVNRGVPVVIRLADYSTVDREPATREPPDEGKSRMRTDEPANAEMVEPRFEPQVVQLRLVKELTGVSGAAVAKQHAPAFQFD